MKKILLTLALVLPLSSIAEEAKQTVPDKLQESVIKFLNFTEAAGEKLVNAAETFRKKRS